MGQCQACGRFSASGTPTHGLWVTKILELLSQIVDIHTRETKTQVDTNTHTLMLSTALFIVAPDGIKPKCISAG